MQKIRDLLNGDLRKFPFVQKHRLWNKFCYEVDVIEDVDVAIEAYCRGREVKNYTEKYLRLYGLLQAMFIQQNAPDEMCSILELGAVSKSNNN